MVEIVGLVFCGLGSVLGFWLLPVFWRGEFPMTIPNADEALTRRFQLPDFALAAARIFPSCVGGMVYGFVLVAAKVIAERYPAALGGYMVTVATALSELSLWVFSAGFLFLYLVATTGWPPLVVPPAVRRVHSPSHKDMHKRE